MIGHHELSARFSEILSKGWGISASLFFGPPSVGKRTAAFEISKKLLCVGDRSDDCRCKSCIRPFEDHPDFMCVGRFGKIGVAEADSILSFTSVAPFMSDRKIIVLDNADDSTWEASNRLLKTVEEPPAAVSFFFISSDPDRIIPTIRSRCVNFQFGALSDTDCANIICKKMGFDLPKARILGWLASGSSSDVFARPGSYLKNRDQALNFISTLKSKDPLDALDFVDRVERGEMSVFLDMAMLVLTDVMMIKEGAGDVINSDSRKELEALSKGVDGRCLAAAASIMSKVREGEAYNVNMSMSMKNAVLKVHPLMSAVRP